MKYNLRILIIGILLAAPATAWAVHPFQVDDTRVQGSGNFLFELNHDTLTYDDFKNSVSHGVLSVGAGSSTDFSLDAPYAVLDPSPATGVKTSGKGDLRLTFKQRIFENEVKQSMAYRIYVDMPTGNVDRGLGTNEVVYGVSVMDQQECHGNVLHASAGYEVYAKDAKRQHFIEDHAFTFGLAFERRIAGALTFLTEVAGETRKARDPMTDVLVSSRPVTFMAGLKYDITKWWYLDVAGRKGLNKYGEDHSVLAGTAWRF